MRIENEVLSGCAVRATIQRMNIQSALVLSILKQWRSYEWTVQGFGFIRTKLEDVGRIGEPEDVLLSPGEPETYWQGASYEQKPEEIHRTIAQDGTVTLIERPQGPPLEEACVYWPRGTQWVSAEPKPAEEWRVAPVIAYALSRWNPA
jgi:hypothetical protein